jgi:NhaP-type Na+/H+ or K+/H+ antiporter
LGLGIGGSAALRYSAQRGWTAGSWLQLPVVALSLFCFALAQWLGGSGFIASLVGGMTFGALTRQHKQAVLEAAEGAGDALAMLTWFAFGTFLFIPSFMIAGSKRFLGCPDQRITSAFVILSPEGV